MQQEPTGHAFCCTGQAVPPPTPGPTSAPAGLTVTVIKGVDGGKSSKDSFCREDDEDGLEFKPNNAVSLYLPPRASASFPTCCHATVVVKTLCSISKSKLTLSSNNIILPPASIRALSQAISLEDLGEALRLVVTDTSATNHMRPDRPAFISYMSIHNLRVQMGKNSYVPVLGCGTAIISLNGQHLFICNVLHVPALCVPLYSLWAHLCQPGCGFVGHHDTSIHVYFPGVILSVDMSTDCHLSYEPLGKSAPLSILHYVQPRGASATYPTESLTFRVGSGPITSLGVPLLGAPAVIKDDASITNSSALPSMRLSPVPHPSHPGPAAPDATPTFISPVPKQAPATTKSFSANDIASIVQHLQVLSDKLSGLQPPPPSSHVTSGSLPTWLLSTLFRDEVV